MRAMVLCAGLGTRLRPLTNRWPKPAMPLLGAPLFRSAVATLTRAGLTDLGINTHHLPEVMAQTAQAECARAGCSLTISHEAGELQGTGGGIRGLRAFLRDGDFVVFNGDVLFAVDLAPALEAHRHSGAAATMLLLPMPEGETYNAVEVDPAGLVRRIAGKGPGGARLANWHFTGVHVLTPSVFDFMAPSGPEDINRDIYVRMLEAGLKIRAHLLTTHDGYWSDLGTPQRYLATHQDLLCGQVSTAQLGSANPFSGESVKRDGNFYAHPSAQLGDARVSGPAWFGAGSELGVGVRIGAAVSVGPGARVGAGARLNRVAVLDGAEVPVGASLQDAIVAPGGVVVHQAP
jgi:mannose-1-phosphate guanylyltransferase